MEMILVKPKQAGAVIRFPGNPGRVLAAEGELVPKDRFWLRRLDGGDVIHVPAAKEKKTTTQSTGGKV